VQGKMWRQVQAMGRGMRSKVRLSVGEPEWYDIVRGVAQGAAESPWLYSNFVNGLVAELKSRGLGVMVGGVRVPLLMYADDIVMLAGTVTELRAMNVVATEYAFKNRFRHNGDKSAVMVFNPDTILKERVQQEVWVLSGERVEVKNKYKYLGVDVMDNVMDWRTHVERSVTKAVFRSNDLLWMCKRDQGLRPRSAATLWKSMVRPILEYAIELWAGDIPKILMARVERVQTDFARGVMGISHCKFGVSNDFVRSEMGMETIASRGEKLRLGYWRKIQVAEQDRALVVVAGLRAEQVRWGVGRAGSLSWIKGTRELLQGRGLAGH
jgi:hypothetical protein